MSEENHGLRTRRQEEPDLKGKKVMVLGLARTGMDTARFLASRQARVCVSDQKSAAELKEPVASLQGVAEAFYLGGEDPRWLDAIDLVVPSPGVPAENPLLREATRRGIEVLSEIELAYRFLHAKLIAVTGTNGKSTTTTLIGKVLEASGLRTFTGGNIGIPLIRFAAETWDWGVVEVSSFQLEWVKRFRPRIAVLLNVTEDHLDRYPHFQAYSDAKKRIFAAQRSEDIAVLNRQDPAVWAMRESLQSRVVSFGWDEVLGGVFCSGDRVVWRREGEEITFPLSRVKIQGVHNIENLMATVAAVQEIGIPQAAAQKVFEAFPGLEHRLEFVREKDGVRFYNDSKGTNVGAVVKSLESFSGLVILLAGGIDKGGDYGPLAGLIRDKVKALILFGAAKEKIRGALGHLTETRLVSSLEEAVREASARAGPGDVVLLSPACSSFDMFRDYAERGKIFKALVRAL